jgi:hypothetical protein
MSENTIEQGDDTQAAEDELNDQELGKAFRDDSEEEEEHRRQLAEEEDAE